jgi:solute carrier family 35 (UDP-sugar transporter), member A1/2/3
VGSAERTHQALRVDDDGDDGAVPVSPSTGAATMVAPPTMWTRAGASSATRLKILSLVLLVAQNSAHALLIRYSRTTAGPPYLASTTVVVGELIKLLVSLVVVLREAAAARGPSGRGSGESGGAVVRQLLSTSLRVMVPAALYALQNNLIFVALSNLDAATFQVMYQFKIITTALFSVAMLRKSLSLTQWIALLLLFQGVVLVQTPSCADQAAAAAGLALATPHRNVFLGLVVVIAISVSSGFAGVYFERLLKSAAQTSLFARNLQLSVWGLIFSVVGMLASDGQAILAHGFFQGYTASVWAIIVVAAFGGLLIAVVVKYTDNIAKGFATSVSIIVSSVVSAAFLHFELTTVFITGASIVILSVLLYSDPDRAATSPGAGAVAGGPGGSSTSGAGGDAKTSLGLSGLGGLPVSMVTAERSGR